MKALFLSVALAAEMASVTLRVAAAAGEAEAKVGQRSWRLGTHLVSGDPEWRESAEGGCKP